MDLRSGQQVGVVEEEAAHLAQDEAQRRGLDAQTDAQIGQGLSLIHI